MRTVIMNSEEKHMYIIFNEIYICIMSWKTDKDSNLVYNYFIDKFWYWRLNSIFEDKNGVVRGHFLLFF